MLKGRKVAADKLTSVGRALAFPQIPEGLIASNNKLRSTAEARWPIDAEALMQSAREATKLHDFGEEPFLMALQQLCQSCNQELDLSPVGRRNLYFQIRDHLIQRLRFADLWQRHPEILDEPIEAPIFIVGLPRSGTTFLQQLLAADERFRPVPFWENLSPLPQHDPAIRPPDDAPLIEQAQQNVEGIRLYTPEVLALHQLSAEMPEEEIYLLAPGFASMVYEWIYAVPSFARWYAEADLTAGYGHFRKVLQTLQWMRGGGKRWLLKAPQHMEQLGPLLAAFPDAVVVETLRDPLTSAASLANLCSHGQKLRTDNPNPLVAGEASAYAISRLVAAYVRDRPEHSSRFVSVHFKALMSNPIAAAESILAAARMTMTDAARHSMQAYVAANAAKERVSPDYSPEDFGIDVAQLRVQFQPYYRRFGVEPDPRYQP